MKTLIRHHNAWTHLGLTLSLSLGAAACADDATDEVTEIASQIEQENGGLDMEDEAPSFGDEALFADAEIATETETTDPMETDPEVGTILDAADAAAYGVTILWGQVPGNRANELARDWDGTFSVNRGAILIRRVIMFEDATDAVAPRTDRRVVEFTSHTQPHMDGLRLVVLDPTPGADEPLVLTYTPVEGDAIAVEVNALVETPMSHEFDDAGNRMVAVALRHRFDRCAHGFVGGRWHRVAEGRGRLIGRVTDADGRPAGHIRGVWGVRESGEHVFFGKYIGPDGAFRGLFRGHYGEGQFEGRWIIGSGDHGVMRGLYRETIEGPEMGGHFLGRWAETSCELPVSGS